MYNAACVGIVPRLRRSARRSFAQWVPRVVDRWAAGLSIQLRQLVGGRQMDCNCRGGALLSCRGCNGMRSETRATISSAKVAFACQPPLTHRRNLEALAAAAGGHGTLRGRCDAARVHLTGARICDAAANAANRARWMAYCVAHVTSPKHYVMGCKHLGRLAYSEGERSCRWGGVAQFLGPKSYQILGPKSNQILVKLLAWISERKFKKIEKSI